MNNPEPTLFRWQTSWGEWTYRTERPAGWKDLPRFEAYILAAPSDGAQQAQPVATECTPIHANEDGWTDWQFPIHRGYKMQCCDCGLVHEAEFDVEKIVEHHEDGSWRSETVQDTDYRVGMRMRRETDPAPSLTVSQAFMDKFKAATRATNPIAVMTLVDEANDLLSISATPPAAES